MKDNLHPQAGGQGGAGNDDCHPLSYRKVARGCLPHFRSLRFTDLARSFVTNCQDPQILDRLTSKLRIHDVQEDSPT